VLASGITSAGTQAAIEFYGTAIDTPYSGQRVYWLVEQGKPGLRVPKAAAAGSPAPQAPFFQQTLELKPRTTYFAALLRENTDNFFGPLISPTPDVETVNLSNLAAGEGILTVLVQGVTDGQQHQVTVMLNGATLGDVAFRNQEAGSAQFAVNAGTLTNGANTITLIAQQGANDLSLIEYGLSQRVLLASPITLIALLTTVLMLSISASAEIQSIDMTIFGMD